MKKMTLLALVASALVVSGCSKLSKENYETLKVGMEYSDVTGVIGEPDNCSETLGTKNCIWGNDDKNIKVTFVADKATLFSNSGLK